MLLVQDVEAQQTLLVHPTACDWVPSEGLHPVQAILNSDTHFGGSLALTYTFLLYIALAKNTYV